MNNWKDEILKKWTRDKKVNPVAITDAIRDRLAREVKGEVLFREPMSRHTTIRIGGAADVFIKPVNLEDLICALKISREEKIPSLLLGGGSNTLVKDGGIRGFVISTPSALQGHRILNERDGEFDVLAEAGVGITAFINFARDHSLSGMEPLVGIPGTIGGAIVMNAGARGTEIKDVIREIALMDHEGQIKKIPRENLEFTYRHLKIPRSNIVVEGVFRLQKGDRGEITERIKNYQKLRVETQPLNYPNLGSVFKNPKPPSVAARLIEEAGLKNVRVGGARISDKHANFIINEKDATARDVMVLINLVRDKVKEATGILLETEIKIVGEDDK